MIIHTTLDRDQITSLLSALAAFTRDDLQNGDSGQQLEFPGIGDTDENITPDATPGFEKRFAALNNAFGNSPPPLPGLTPGAYFEALRDLVYLKREASEPCLSVEDQADYLDRAEAAWDYAEGLVDAVTSS